MIQNRIAFLLILVCGVFLLAPVVHADMLIPSITRVYFDKDGVPYNGTVHYTMTCYGYTRSIAPGPGPAPGSYQPDPVFRYSATCRGYGCTVYPQYYLKYTIIDWCAVEGETDEGPFVINDTFAKPYTDYAINTPAIQDRWPEEFPAKTRTEDNASRSEFFQTPEYTACMYHHGEMARPGGNRTAELRFFSSCNNRTDSRCYSLFEGYGDIAAEGPGNFSTFLNATRDRMDDARFNRYLDSCNPLTDRECSGWILDGRPIKTYTNLFPFRRNESHLQKYPCDRFLVGINASLVIPKNDRSGRGCIHSCSVAEDMFIANFSIPQNSPESREVQKTRVSPGMPGLDQILGRLLSWLKLSGPAKLLNNPVYSGTWQQISANASSIVRQGHSSVVMPDGSIILMGGFTGTVNTNDVWRSDDAGATWTEVAIRARWQARSGQSSVVTPDGSIVLMGGHASEYPFYLNDTWMSPDSGRTWLLMNASSGWPVRDGQCSVVTPDGRIILTGGASRELTIPYNDTWQSADNGRTWMPVNASSGWPPGYCHCSMVMPDGSIVLISSGDEVWRSADSGTTWTRMAVHPGWAPRYGQSCVAMPDGSMILMGGEGQYGVMNDVWRSGDSGATWTRMSSYPGWTFFYGHSSVVMPDGSIVLIDDQFRNRVWQLRPAG